MGSIDELILRITKEIVVKFIETGRVGPAGFQETFESVYQTVAQTVKAPEDIVEPSDDPTS